MLQKVTMQGIELPRLYIAENMEDVRVAKANGIPFICWNLGKEQLIRQLLRPTIEKMFPGINWNRVLGYVKPVKSKVVISTGHEESELPSKVAEIDSEEMLEAQLEYDEIVDDLDHDTQEPDESGVYEREVDIAEDNRDCIGGQLEPEYNSFKVDRLSVEDYVGDLSSSVDIDVLQKLGLLPKFVGDITDCIKHNVSQSMRWTEGYTKKLGYPLGKFNAKGELPNLLIIDISASIPDGIAATMITLADTLRNQCNAELIITSARSGYYPIGSKLPKPQTLRDYYGRSNESYEFWGIIQEHVAGREFGNVISFGDNDNPGWCDLGKRTSAGRNMIGTKVHKVYHYHTWRGYAETGYARWVKECCPDVEMEFDNSWCNVMNKGYRL